jgi:hypothetical protein
MLEYFHMNNALSFAGILLFLSVTASCQDTHHKALTIGDTIPAFHLTDQDGKIVFTYNSPLNGSKHAEEALAFLKKNPNL